MREWCLGLHNMLDYSVADCQGAKKRRISGPVSGQELGARNQETGNRKQKLDIR